ncbi:PI31 proteasome regulator N-terminal-domain-containing protein [Lineolata rhizophorae]|uniref:PI31 proteasome regulator N-terminal-domain-containing protein n=1 Tax=Lineolata rhizophorae TaxID=578093 RepID=A0A6A6P520_9PEZI|nr:PI31 proteasome regulator N-terminal-domain-containing protein [Lineolata rhizophorae]
MAPVSGNPLSAGSLAALMVSSLPPTSSPQLNSAWDAIALAAHAGMVAVGFKLIALGNEGRLDTPSDAAAPAPLPARWNAHSDDYGFRYLHPQSSMEYMLKVTRLGGQAVVLAVALGDNHTETFDVSAEHYISSSLLPATPLPGGEEATATKEEAERKMTDIFMGPGRLSDFGNLLKANIIQKLAPGLRKEGYEETTTVETSSSRQQQQPRRPDPADDPLRDPRYPPARPYVDPLADPLVQPPRRPVPAGDFPPPDFEDEYEINRPPRMPGGAPYHPGIGERDLYPPGLGPHDPMRPGGIGPNPFGGGGGAGGMHPTFDDPLFAGGPGRGGERGGADPQAPPGARWDPVGPGGGPRFSGQGGRPPNPFGGFGDGDFI